MSVTSYQFKEERASFELATGNWELTLGPRDIISRAPPPCPPSSEASSGKLTSIFSINFFEADSTAGGAFSTRVVVAVAICRIS